MRWQATLSDILDVPADVLVCSANIYLTLSGGVGGAFLLRYGSAMQDALQAYLLAAGRRHVERGHIIQMPPCGSPYVAVLHAVAVDGLYESSAAVISQVVTRSLQMAAASGARTVTLPLLATGYGRLSVVEFLAGIREVMRSDFAPVERVVLCVRSEWDFREVMENLPELASSEAE